MTRCCPMAASSGRMPIPPAMRHCCRMARRACRTRCSSTMRGPPRDCARARNSPRRGGETAMRCSSVPIFGRPVTMRSRRSATRAGCAACASMGTGRPSARSRSSPRTSTSMPAGNSAIFAPIRGMRKPFMTARSGCSPATTATWPREIPRKRCEPARGKASRRWCRRARRSRSCRSRPVSTPVMA